MGRSLAISLVFPLAGVACFSSSQGPDASPDAYLIDVRLGTSPEAAVEASLDASVPDVPMEAIADATVEAPVEATVDAGVPVVVTVLGAAGPESGVVIVYGDASGAFLATQATDASGQASRVVAAGSMVTALLGDPTVYSSPTTIMGVQPGDALTVVDWGSLPTPSDTSRTACTGADVTSVPSPPANTSFYVASAGLCTSGTGALPLSLSLGGQCGLYQGASAGPSGCLGVGTSGVVGPATFPLLVQAYDSSDQPLAFLAQKGNALPVPGSAGDAGDSGSPADAATDLLSLGGTWSTAMTSQMVSIANAPEGGNTFAPMLSEAVGGTLTTLPQLIVGAGVPFTTHVGFADFVQVEASTTVYFQSALAMATAVPAPTADGTIPMDLTPLASMPVLNAATADVTVPARPVVSWTTSQGSLSTVTGIVAFASWSGGGAEGGAQAGTWTIVAPPSSQASVQAPELPPSASGWAPSGSQSVYDNLEVWGVQGSALPTYGAVRAAASAFKETPACNIHSPVIPALPSVGTSLMVTLWSSAGCG